MNVAFQHCTQENKMKIKKNFKLVSVRKDFSENVRMNQASVSLPSLQFTTITNMLPSNSSTILPTLHKPKSRV